MGRRKVNSINKKTQKNTSKSKKASKTFSTDLLGGFTVVLGFIMLVFLGFSNIGFIADLFKNISKGFFGNVSYLVPITFIVTGIYVIVSDKKVNITKQILKGLLLVSLISILVASCVYKYENINSGIIKLIVDSYNNATTGTNISGFVGSIISMMIISLIGKVATIILFSFVTFITTLCVFNLSFKQFFNGVASFFKCLFNLFSYICSILFRNDENDEEDYEDDEDISKDSVNIQNNAIKGNKKIRKSKNFALEKNSSEIDEMLEEKGTKNVDDNIKISSAEQLEFDINKLGVKPSKEEIEAKQQRDQFFKKQKEQKEDKSVKEVLTIDHAELIEQDNYEFPSIELLTKPKEGEEFDKRIIRSTALKLQKTLASFGVEAKVTNITKGPTVTRYELTPSTGVKVSKIVNLSDDIALNLEAKSIRIEAPIPGKAAVGIEVPNKVSESVLLREVIDSQKFADHSSKLAFALGKDAAGEIAIGDIAKMPHVLIAGATGSGKSVCINSILVSLLYKAKPSEVKLILIDPKMVELSGYNGIPHLLIPVVTDPKKAAGALNWAVQEMVKRYGLFASAGVKDLKGYNKIIEQKEGAKLPQIVIIVDELADLMMVAPNDVEDAICRLAQMARAAGMHLVIATQRPSVDVITGIIKANIPSRIAFTVSSQVDSRTILDMAGAEKLLGKGDMLYFPVGETKPLRIQGTFISESEIDKIVEEIKSNNNSTYSEDIIESIEKSQDSKNGNNSNETGDDADSLLEDAIDLVVDLGQASASMLQRRFKIGYSRAGRIVDQMEARGLISGYEGSKPRQVLVSKEEWQELKMGNTNNSLDNSENNSESFNNTSNVGYDSDNIVKAEVSRLENENKTKYDVQT